MCVQTDAKYNFVQNVQQAEDITLIVNQKTIKTCYLGSKYLTNLICACCKGERDQDKSKSKVLVLHYLNVMILNKIQITNIYLFLPYCRHRHCAMLFIRYFICLLLCFMRQPYTKQFFEESVAFKRSIKQSTF